MLFEELPTAPTAEELLDQAFSRAARTGGTKSGREAQEAMLTTASNVLGDNLANVVRRWPDLDAADPFYRDVGDAICRRELETVDGAAGLDAVRRHLSEVGWAARKVDELADEYRSRIRSVDGETARGLRKQAFARMASVVEEVAPDLVALNQARGVLRTLPEVRPEEPTIVVAGMPNVGKSSFVNSATRATIEIAEYPFTSRRPALGHVERDHVRYQLLDTPGLLDRPAAERNDVEVQAVSAIVHLADCVLVLLDASGTCGYPLDDQLELRDEVCAMVSVPCITVCNKADLSTEVDAEHYMSLETGDNVDAVLSAAIDAIDHEPTLPSREDEISGRSE